MGIFETTSLDLHLHTNYSDGILDPESLVELLRKRKVKIFSITDHDCIEAFWIGKKKAAELGMTCISGIELNTERQGEEIHILGYDFRPDDVPLKKAVEQGQRCRQARIGEMLGKLQSLGFPLEESHIREIAGRGSIGRPHLALALLEKHYVKSVQEAFQNYLGYGKPAWTPRDHLSPKEAISIIREAGGIPVLAHPNRGGKSQMKELVEWGLQGIEVYYPAHTQSLIRKLLRCAEQFHLLVTAGSDYHGINPGEKGPGNLKAPEKVIEEWKRITEGRTHEESRISSVRD